MPEACLADAVGTRHCAGRLVSGASRVPECDDVPEVVRFKTKRRVPQKLCFLSFQY
jgi:hypothetical protein